MPGAYEHIYVHLPFCEVICHYCDFYTARTKGAHFEEFFAALGQEARRGRPEYAAKLKALYLGGGTPSASPANLLSEFFSLWNDRITAETEVTLEANPADIKPENLKAWRDAGVNRISLGIQSLDNAALKRLGRVHSAESALAALRLAREYFDNVSGDLIYAVPGQALGEPAAHALRMAEAGATHISAYHLTLEPSHFLHPRLPDDTHALAQVKALADALAEKDFEHYEISNFGLPGRYSRNNWNYWSGGPYWALGPSAHGFDGQSRRWQNVADWEEYVRRCAAGQSPIAEEEALGAEQRMMEVLFTSLRTRQGLNLRLFEARFGVDLETQRAALWAVWEKEGLGALANGWFVPSFSGRMLADSLAQKLL